jgi:hypothetical protein
MSPRPRKNYANLELLADETAVATLTPPADPTAIAERVSRQQADRQTANLLDAVSRWRTIVADVSAGKEPDGQTLDQIGELVNVLRLPSGSLATHVGAWRENERLDGVMSAAAGEIKRTQARNQEIAAEVKTLESRLGELRLELQKYYATSAGYPSIVGARNENQLRNPLLFGDPAVVAQSLEKSRTGLGLATMRGSSHPAQTYSAWE